MTARVVSFVGDHWFSAVVLGAIGYAVFFVDPTQQEWVIAHLILFGVSVGVGAGLFTAWRGITRRPRLDRSPMAEEQRDEFDRLVDFVLELTGDDVGFFRRHLDEDDLYGIGYTAAERRAWLAVQDSNRFWSLEEALDELSVAVKGSDTAAVTLAVMDLIDPRDFDLLWRPWCRTYHAWVVQADENRPQFRPALTTRSVR